MPCCAMRRRGASPPQLGRAHSLTPRPSVLLPSIPWQSPSQEQQYAFYREVLTHPLTIALLLLGVVTIAAAALIAHHLRDPERRHEGGADALLCDAPPGRLAAAARESTLPHPPPFRAPPVDPLAVAVAGAAIRLLPGGAYPPVDHRPAAARCRHHRRRGADRPSSARSGTPPRGVGGCLAGRCAAGEHRRR